MKKTFMWYYSIIWLVIVALYLLSDMFFLGDPDSFWSLALITPIIIWLFNIAK
jgi:hypothetical protein